MQGVGASVNELLDEFGNGSSGSPFLRETLGLLGSRNFSSDEQPEESLGKGLGSTRSSGQLLLALGDGLASESDTLLGVKDGSFPNEALVVSGSYKSSKRGKVAHLDTSHTTVGLVDGDLTERLVAVSGSDGLYILNLLRDKLGQSVLEGLGVSDVGSRKSPSDGRSELKISLSAWSDTGKRGVEI